MGAAHYLPRLYFFVSVFHQHIIALIVLIGKYHILKRILRQKAMSLKILSTSLSSFSYVQKSFLCFRNCHKHSMFFCISKHSPIFTELHAAIFQFSGYFSVFKTLKRNTKKIIFLGHAGIWKSFRKDINNIICIDMMYKRKCFI